jgi:tRNA dimethylallyltransferase
MVAAGLPEEVRSLLEGGLKRNVPGFKTLGYTEWAGWALGEYDSDAAMELFVRNSRRYAKRQDTWFRNRHPDRVEILIGVRETAEESAKRVLDTLKGDT